MRNMLFSSISSTATAWHAEYSIPCDLSPLLVRFLGCCLLLATLSPLHAEFVGWHPALALQPGYGLEYRQQYLLKPRVALLDFGAATNYSGTGSASYSAFFSQHQLDLVRRFSLNVNASAKYNLYSGKVGFSYVDDTAYTGNTLNFVFECNRDYGFTRFRPLGLDPDFAGEITRLRQTLRGQALQNAITERFGDYFISGYKSVGKVAVIYTFNFESQTTTRSIAARIAGKYKNGVTSVQFQSDVQSFFQQTDSRVSMSYRFFSSDPDRPLLFPTNQITTYSQFIDFSTVVGDYVNDMTRAGAALMEFIVEPMQNLPGYSALVEGSSSTNQIETDYDRFLDAYGVLKQWGQQLTDWTIDNRGMNWMNTNGQRLVLTMRREVADYLKTLEYLAKSHFTTGSPLEVPEDIFNYFANFNRIPMPTLGLMAWRGHLAGGGCDLPGDRGGNFFIGYLLCGSPNLTKEVPFLSVSLLFDGNDTGLAGFLYSFSDWQRISVHMVSGCQDLETYVRTSTDEPLWKALQTMTNDCRIQVFYVYFTKSQNVSLGRYSIAVRDNAGNTVDAIPFETSRMPTSAASLAASPRADLSVGAVARPATAAIDSAASYEYAITNNGPGAAYGVTFSLSVPHGMQAQSVTGSQGQGLLTNGAVQFDVGPLASGSVAKVSVTLVPLRTGRLGGDTCASIAAGECLVDSQPANDSTPSPGLTVTAPALALNRGTDYVELSWTSETGRLLPQVAPQIADPTAWSPLTNGIVSDGCRKTLRVPLTTSSQFFRLQALAR